MNYMCMCERACVCMYFRSLGFTNLWFVKKRMSSVVPETTKRRAGEEDDEDEE